MAGDVVEMQHRRPAQRGGQPSGEGGLPGAGVPVHADQPDRPQGGRKPAQPVGEVLNGDSRGVVRWGAFSGNSLVAAPGGGATVRAGTEDSRILNQWSAAGRKGG
ncbi:hypothetical protein GCM10010503_30150 [Streptomyces lucensis JCM 4490]|uniref:Uncharacterized protein n=1 Tax=Streptomyces lucensis JCM 4490 TaxID=1306176 RepID=A0A918J9B9_9ACTN|nr:hypothetical protein GCM10010503_30150 [Streptomyces lucensis JCM 4490]